MSLGEFQGVQKGIIRDLTVLRLRRGPPELPLQDATATSVAVRLLHLSNSNIPAEN
jgi:hypothetical protein